MALTSTDWLLSTGWRQGLFTHCIDDLSQPIPFNYEAKETGCYPSRDVCKYSLYFFCGTGYIKPTSNVTIQPYFSSSKSVYIKATAGLCIISLLTDAIATFLTGIGLQTKNQNTKYKFYRRAVFIMLIACKLCSTVKVPTMSAIIVLK